MELSIIIPTYNRKDKLSQCLDVLLNQNYPADKYEIIIIDDGSTDGTEEAVAGINNPRITYIKQQNRGAGAAINTGAKVAKGEILAFTEDDCIVNAEWLKTIMALFKKYPNASAFVGPCPYAELEAILNKKTRRNNGDLVKMELKKMNTFLNIGNGSFAIKKEAFEKIGGYDESFKAEEDLDFNIRLLKQGYDIFISQELKAMHYARNKMMQVFKRTYKLAISEAKLVKRHFGRRFTLYISSGLFNLDKTFSFPFPATFFIKIYLFDILLLTTILSILYQPYILFLVLALCLIRFKKYKLRPGNIPLVFKVSSWYILEKFAFFAGFITGSIKYKVFIF